MMLEPYTQTDSLFGVRFSCSILDREEVALLGTVICRDGQYHS